MIVHNPRFVVREDVMASIFEKAWLWVLLAILLSAPILMLTGLLY